MERGIGVYLKEGIPFTYKDFYSGQTKDAITEPGWHMYDGTYVKGGEPSPFTFKYGTLLLTNDGTIIEVKRPCYTSRDSRPERPDFWIKQSSNKDTEGYAVYYSNQLKNRGGNHKRANEDLDIVGIFDGDLMKRCPHCNHTMDDVEISELTD
jgi:hypothetical protein